MPTRSKPRVFVDADVIFAGAASPSEHGASLVTLRMGEITLIDAVTSCQAITEAERNLSAKLPRALTTFRLLVERSLRVVPAPSRQDFAVYEDIADPKDLPILGAAVRERCQWLVTFNVGDFEPGHPDVTVLRPGAFIQRVRTVLTYMDLGGE
jgi:predicted nucleic acid-binding protein